MSAGALVAGVATFENAVRLADRGGADSDRIQTRLVLAEALIHTLGGLDEAGLATLTEAERIAVANGDREAVTRVRAEVGYVDFLRARYDRAERSLGQVLGRGGDVAVGPGQGDDLPRLRGERPGGVPASRRAAAGRGAAPRGRWANRDARPSGWRCWVGSACCAETSPGRPSCSTAAGDLAERDHWLSFLPWPQAMLGQAWLSAGDLDAAARTLEQSFARACQIGDPCWEGISARGLAMLAEARGDVDQAFAVLLDARARTNRLADPYVWLDVHILDALCEIGRRHGHPQTAAWADAMLDRASRTGMRELTVRAMLHEAASGVRGDAGAAALLAADIDNPELAGWSGRALPG